MAKLETLKANEDDETQTYIRSQFIQTRDSNAANLDEASVMARQASSASAAGGGGPASAGGNALQFRRSSKENLGLSGLGMGDGSGGRRGSGSGAGASTTDLAPAASLPPPSSVTSHAAAGLIPAKHLPSSASDAQLDAVVKVCEQIRQCDWDADLLTLCATLRSPMSFVVRQLLDMWGAVEALGTTSATLDALLGEIEKGYLPNPYHNATHAADVAYTTHVMLHHGVKQALDLTDMQCAVCVLAAAAHDFRHPGIGANYLIAMGDDLALTYNDRSPLESMHTSQFFFLLKAKPECNVFSAVEAKEVAAIRKCIIAMILATDMSVHFDYLDKFQKRFAAPLSEETTLSEDEQNFAMAMLLHCADISNPAKPQAAYFDWTDRVLAEFYHQGDLEKEHGLAISTFYDRTKPAVGKMQAGFIQFIVRPIFGAWCDFVPALKDLCMHHIEAHAVLWKADEPPIPAEQLYVAGGKADWDWKAAKWRMAPAEAAKSD